MSCVVFDLEFNQAAKGETVISEPFLFHAEIVQIGAVKVDEDFNITDTFDVIVKPSYYTKIGSAVKKLISHNHKSFEDAVDFPTAYEAFARFCGDCCCLYSWGSSDAVILEKNMKIHGIQPSPEYEYFDLQKLYCERIGKKAQAGLKEAVKRLGTTLYAWHNALNDAYSAAEILAEIRHRERVIERGKTKRSARVSDKEIFIDAVIPLRSEAVKIVKEALVKCECGAESSVDGVFYVGKNKLLGASCCSCGKEYLITAILKKIPADQSVRLTCGKEIMDSIKKVFYSKQKKLDDVLKDYALKHSRRR